jgi:hypothetical protein
MHHGVLDQGDDVVVGDAVADTRQMNPWNVANASILPVSGEAKGAYAVLPAFRPTQSPTTGIQLIVDITTVIGGSGERA